MDFGLRAGSRRSQHGIGRGVGSIELAVMNVGLGAGSGRSQHGGGRDVGSMELAAVNLNLEGSSGRSQHGGGQVVLWVCTIDCAVRAVGMGTCPTNPTTRELKKAPCIYMGDCGTTTNLASVPLTEKQQVEETRLPIASE